MESLKSGRWFRNPCHSYKIFTKRSFLYLFDMVFNLNRVHYDKNGNNVPTVNVNHG